MLFFSSWVLIKFLPEWQANSITTWHLALTFIFVSQFVMYMFIGVVFHYLHIGRLNENKAYLILASIFLLFCVDWWMGPNIAGVEAIWSYGIAILIFMFAFSFQGLFRSNILFDFLANISYPLYVIHGVAGYIALRVLAEQGVSPVLSLTIVTGVCILCSWILHVLVERPAQLFGKLLDVKLSR